jgi:phosphoribosylaminoimidazolecarboxamide formyltransferase/IMP cyclohydrolase
LSVYDKTGIVDFARKLVDLGWEIISSGGTANHLLESGLDVIEVSDVTGAQEMLDGRVKTLHPKIHGGILADRSNREHLQELESRGIKPIDLVVVNLYPFVKEPGIELIDIGGPTMVRAAAKNFESVGVVVDPSKYEFVIDEIRQEGSLTPKTRRDLARDAFAHTAGYDSEIVSWFDDGQEELPKSLHLSIEKTGELRYGENPHQVGARYRFINASSWWDKSIVHGGKPMSYLNIFDTEAAWRMVNQLGDEPSAVVVKHANPCGAATAKTIEEAYKAAHECDPISAFGGIVALNRAVTTEVSEKLSEIFTEVVIAPSYEDKAVQKLKENVNLRIIEAGSPTSYKFDYRNIDGGLLVQTSDTHLGDLSEWVVVTERQPNESEWIDLEFAWKIVASVSSNGIVLSKNRQAVGIGVGQPNRRDAARIATEKAAGRAAGGACASDAFFPFRDGLDAAIDASASAVIQPGGSVRDDEVIEAANEANLTMVFTGIRHFRH